jgi:hypothetical protein
MTGSAASAFPNIIDFVPGFTETILDIKDIMGAVTVCVDWIGAITDLEENLRYY